MSKPSADGVLRVPTVIHVARPVGSAMQVGPPQQSSHVGIVMDRKKPATDVVKILDTTLMDGRA
jgi:hypothetical protein